MSSTYPTTLDSLSTTHSDSTSETIHAATVNDLADAVNKIEAELGTLPKGSAADVKTRIANTETVANAAVPKSTVTTAGDLIYGTGSAAVARLGAGSAGQHLATGATPSWVYPPGYEFGYTQITSSVNVVSTTEATGTTIITAGAITFDGAAVMVEFFSPLIATPSTAGGFVTVSLFESTTQITRLVSLTSPAAANMQAPVHARYRFTPSAAAHTYTITAYTSSTTGTPAVFAGAAGTGTYAPAYVRFTKV